MEYMDSGCKRHNIRSSESMNWDSAFQRRVWLNKVKAVALQLKDLVTQTKSVCDRTKIRKVRRLTDALDFLVPYIRLLAAVVPEDCTKLTRSVSGKSYTILVTNAPILVSETIDAFMESLVNRIANGFHPTLHEAVPEKTLSFPELLLDDLGWDLDTPIVAKLPVDLIFKVDTLNKGFSRSLSQTMREYVERILDCWSELPIDPPEAPPPAFAVPIPRDPFSAARVEPVRSARVVTPLTASIDLSKNIAPPQTQLFPMFGKPAISFERHRDCATTVLDLLSILCTFLNAALPGEQSNPLRNFATPMMYLLLKLYLFRDEGKTGSSEGLYDEIVAVLVEHGKAPKMDPFGLGPMLLSQHEYIRAAHHKYLRKDLLLETLEVIVSKVIPDLDPVNFLVFHSSLAEKLSERVQQKVLEACDGLRAWLNTFQGVFDRPPPGDFFKERFWKAFNPRWNARPLHSPPVTSPLKNIDLVDTRVKLRAGTRGILTVDQWYLDARLNPYDSKILDELNTMEDRVLILPELYDEHAGKEGWIPLPMAWEALCIASAKGGVSPDSPLLPWMLSKRNGRLPLSAVPLVVPGCNWNFKPDWFTSMKKICFHLFLHTGALEVNPFNKITGLTDLFNLMNRHYLLWEALSEGHRKLLRNLVPMFSILKPELGIQKHVVKVIEYWKFLWNHQKGLLIEPHDSWNHEIQVPTTKQQLNLFSSFPSCARARLEKSEKAMSGPLALKVAMMYLIRVMEKAQGLWDSIIGKCTSAERDGASFGPLLMRAHAWNSIGFMYASTMHTALRSQNFSTTNSKNPTTMWTPTLVLTHMDSESFDISCAKILAKNHQGAKPRVVSVELQGAFETARTGITPIQILAVRLFVIRKLLLQNGIRMLPHDLTLNDNWLFPWDVAAYVDRDWRDIKPSIASDSSWGSVGSFIFKTLPQGHGMQPITITMLRKTLVSLERGAGGEATRAKTGHKAVSSVEHYFLDTPWINKIVSLHEPRDRPMLAKTILAFQAKNFLSKEGALSYHHLLRIFTYGRCATIIREAKTERNKGVQIHLDGIELQCWARLWTLYENPFTIGVDVFLTVLNSVIAKAYKSNSSFPPQSVLGAGALGYGTGDGGQMGSMPRGSVVCSV